MSRRQSIGELRLSFILDVMGHVVRERAAQKERRLIDRLVEMHKGSNTNAWPYGGIIRSESDRRFIASFGR